MGNQQIKIAVVDDHTLFRDGLIGLLKEYDYLNILFGAKNGLDLQDKIREYGTPDVILMDINMPLMDGAESLDWLQNQYQLVRTLALSMYEDDINIIKMLRKGAGGYILKESTAPELVNAINSIHQTGYFLNEIVSGKLIRMAHDTKVEKKLTEREANFLILCCTELTYKEIAEKMSVSPRTIDGYRDQLFEKLEIKSRTGLVLYAIKNKYFKDF